MIIIIIVLLNIKTYTYKKDNPRLFDVKYIERPSEEYLHELFDKITEKNKAIKMTGLSIKVDFLVLFLSEKTMRS